MPYDQLSGVQAATSEEVQILPGFTKIFSLSASTSAKLTADGSTLVGEASLQVDVTTSAEMKFLSGRPITGLDVSTSANFDYQGDLTGSCNVATSGDLEMKGNLLGPATCDVTTSSDATIEGSLLENTVINVGTSADLKVTGSVWGKIEASTSSDVTVTSCTNVTLSTSADCNEKNPVDETVTVKVDPQSLTLTGTNKCSGAFARCSNLVLLPSVVVSMLMFGGC
ncbi:expressed unknown protein [Seminavis robusta]|uniref:Uncharacterized protein n=1 Tax=Seminavis robusta TaxID=568900 RepID=A0A9N8ETW1_9STRA|nr:expressed unknown protein [Seminavis robusta]|eukprot:Sro2144_g316320.1 n/a (225) ;mRNA; f:15321-15995